MVLTWPDLQFQFNEFLVLYWFFSPPYNISKKKTTTKSSCADPTKWLRRADLFIGISDLTRNRWSYVFLVLLVITDSLWTSALRLFLYCFAFFNFWNILMFRAVLFPPVATQGVAANTSHIAFHCKGSLWDTAHHISPVILFNKRTTVTNKRKPQTPHPPQWHFWWQQQLWDVL